MAKKNKAKESGEAETLRVQLARALADYDNLRKRVEKERQELTRFASMGIIVRLLPIYDMLMQAQKHLNDSGLAITIGELEDLFKEEGLEKIEAGKGAKFDENIHETVEVEEGAEKGVIEEEILSGWRFKEGPVVRHSKVKVNK
jgi:molecular chaperone GrpE